MDGAVSLDALEPSPVHFESFQTQDCSVENVEDEVAQDVGGQLFVDQLVDAALPPPKDLRETAELAGVGHVGRVGNCHLGLKFFCFWSI